MQVPGYSRDKNPKLNGKGLNLQSFIEKRTKNEITFDFRG